MTDAMLNEKLSQSSNRRKIADIWKAVAILPEPFTADDVAQEACCTATTVRRWLPAMAEVGFIEMERVPFRRQFVVQCRRTELWGNRKGAAS